MKGYPTASAMRRTSAMSSGSTSVAGITGTPAAMATRRALALSPSIRMVSARGPMKVMPAAVQASTSSGFSDSRPYPGWIASAPDIFATRMISGIDR